MKIRIDTITLTLTFEEVYALCNKLVERDLVKNKVGFCEKDQIGLLLKIGKELGTLVGHYSKNNLKIEDGWVVHLGGDVDQDTIERIRFRDELEMDINSETDLRWDHNGGRSDIVAYKLKK